MRPVLRLLPLIVIGAAAALLLVGPLSQLYKSHSVGTRPQSSPSPLASVASPTPRVCPTSPPMPTAAQAPAGPSTLGSTVWVNDPLGVNLRNGPSTSAAKITVLTQGTQLTTSAQSTAADGSLWLKVSVGSQSGWIRSDFVVGAPISLVSGTGWSLMLPAGQQVSVGPSLMSAATTTIDPLPFLTIASAGPTDAAPKLAPPPLRQDYTWSDTRSASVQVWSYTVVEHFSRWPIDVCQFPAAAARPDGGWAWATSVGVTTKNHLYQLLFLSDVPDDPRVAQVLDSVALS